MELIEILKTEKFNKVLDFDFNSRFFIFDFSKNNAELKNINFDDNEEFINYIDKTLKNNNASFGIGKYNEDRAIYKSDLFSQEKRTIHLGIDLWAPVGTKVLAPMAGRIHSFANNQNKGDYGPTVILEHSIGEINFYTLYGHLSPDSFNNIYTGKIFKAGEKVGRIGDYTINGGWPPHLHFQIIRDMQGKTGDFFGVASKKDIAKFLELCPNPNLILKIKELD